MSSSFKKEVCISGTNVPYTLRVHPRSKRMRLILHSDGTLVVTIPLRATIRGAERFLKEKRMWLQKYINLDHIRPRNERKGNSKIEYEAYKKGALKLVKQKVASYNSFYCFFYKKVYVKNHKAQWGSCTEKKNLNFNYRVIHLPEDLQNYLIVHELCHLREFNHSKEFWRLVSLTIPNHANLKRRLREATMNATWQGENALV